MPGHDTINSTSLVQRPEVTDTATGSVTGSVEMAPVLFLSSFIAKESQGIATWGPLGIPKESRLGSRESLGIAKHYIPG